MINSDALHFQINRSNICLADSGQDNLRLGWCLSTELYNGIILQDNIYDDPMGYSFLDLAFILPYICNRISWVSNVSSELICIMLGDFNMMCDSANSFDPAGWH